MTHDSAVQFESNSRIHMGLAVRDIAQSVDFYRVLLGQEPTKTRPGYARFEAADPPVNLALNASTASTGPNDPVTHFGIQVKSSSHVDTIARRLRAAGYPTRLETNVTCCYAVQNKVWATDPDGNRWEVFVVVDDAGSVHAPASSDCCRLTPVSEPAAASNTVCCPAR